MDIGTISRRYAVALYKFAIKHGKEKAIYTEAITLSKSYMQYPALRRTLTNPVLPAISKEKLLNLAVGGDMSDEFLKFIRLIIHQKREMFLQIICLIYQQIYRYEKKLLHVEITTAVAIDKKTEEHIVDKIEQITKETVDINTTVDPGIIGGYIIHWDTYRWDASVTTQLKQIKRELIDKVKIEL